MDKERRTLPVKLVNKAFADPVAICAVAIALCALIATIWQGFVMREHSRKSMLPYIDIHHNFALPDEWLGTSISNEGPGLAILKEVRLMVDGEAIQDPERNGWPAALTKLGLWKPWIKFRHFNPGDVLRSGDERPLMGTPVQQADTDKKKALRKEARRLTVQICYCSVYGECFVIEDRYRARTNRRAVGRCPGEISAPLEPAVPTREMARVSPATVQDTASP